MCGLRQENWRLKLSEILSFQIQGLLAELTLGIDRFLAGLPPIHSPLARFLEAFLTKNVEFP